MKSMKIVALREMKQGLSGYITRAQKGQHVIVTRYGRPAAILTGVAEGKDLEDLLYETDPEFWKMIEARAKQPGGVSIEQARRQLGLDGPQKTNGTRKPKAKIKARR